jgi:hypothetical protein
VAAFASVAEAGHFREDLAAAGISTLDLDVDASGVALG